MSLVRFSRLMLVGVMILSLAAGVIAAQKGKGGQCGCRDKAAMMKQLNLSEAQQTQIKNIREEAKAEAQRIKQSNRTDEQKSADLKALREQTHNRILSVLTPEQRQKLEQMRQQRKGAGVGRGGHQQCMAKLNLTATQQSQAQAIRKTAQDRITEVRSDNTLTQEQKRDKIASIQRVAQRDFLEILTPAQRTELQNCQHGGKGMNKCHCQS